MDRRSAAHARRAKKAEDAYRSAAVTIGPVTAGEGGAEFGLIRRVEGELEALPLSAEFCAIAANGGVELAEWPGGLDLRAFEGPRPWAK